MPILRHSYSFDFIEYDRFAIALKEPVIASESIRRAKQSELMPYINFDIMEMLRLLRSGPKDLTQTVDLIPFAGLNLIKRNLLFV
jgi:hypothetical protein